MTITEEHFMKRTRTSTFTFETINDKPVDDSSREIKPGPLLGLLVRNKFKGINEFALSISIPFKNTKYLNKVYNQRVFFLIDCTIRNIRLWPGYPSFDKNDFHPDKSIWEEESDTVTRERRWRPFDPVSGAHKRSFVQDLHGVDFYFYINHGYYR